MSVVHVSSLDDPRLSPYRDLKRSNLTRHSGLFVVEGDKLSIVGLEDMGKYTNASQIDVRAFKAGMILLTIAPILLIYPLILRYFTKGTMTGAVKG